MRRFVWFPVGLVAVVGLLAASCAGDGGGSEVEEGLPPAEEAPISAEQPEAEGDETSAEALTPTVEDRFSTVVLSQRARNFLLPGEIIESEDLEFVLGAPQEDLERVASVTVRFPDGETTREMFPSTDLGVPLDFFGYYGTGEGLPPAGDYVFEIVMKDGTQFEIVHQHSGKVLDYPENLTTEIDRDGGTISVSWDPVQGTRNYTVDLYEVLPGGEGYTNPVDEVGCPDPDIIDPNDLVASYWKETYCTLTDLNSFLEKGKEYSVGIAVWGDEKAGYTSYLGVNTVPFAW